MQTSKIKEWLRSKLPWTANLAKRLTAKTWTRQSIVYFTENHREGLTPYSLQEGASGSHAAVIFLAREWAKLGYKVTVYSNCGTREGLYDGVEYLNYYRFNWHDTFDTLIIWRHPRMLQPSVKARRICWDWHDLLDPPYAFPPEKIEKFDKIFAKSRYQRTLLPHIPDRKFAIITNGVDKNIARLSDKEKEPYKLIYASRYYRGLELMLTYGWQIIKREIPEASLHLYYGWTRRDSQPSRAEWKQKMLKLIDQDGVIDHGKVGQDELILEKATSTIHYYGCAYEEIDCISVRESAMVGCVPVTTDYAALSEKDYCIKIPGDPHVQETQEAVAYRIVELLKNPQQLDVLRQKFKELVESETWENTAKRWLQHLE